MQVCHLDFLLIPLWYYHFCLKPVWSLTRFTMLSGKSKDLGDLFGPEMFSHSTGWNFEMHPRWAASKNIRKMQITYLGPPKCPSALLLWGHWKTDIDLLSVFSHRNLYKCHESSNGCCISVRTSRSVCNALFFSSLSVEAVPSTEVVPAVYKASGRRGIQFLMSYLGSSINSYKLKANFGFLSEVVVWETDRTEFLSLGVLKPQSGSNIM